MTKTKQKPLLITKEWLELNSACSDGKTWFFNQKQTELSKVIKALIKDEKYEWANWTLTKLMSKEQNVLYSCFAARLSLHYFEVKFPEDKRPLQAIEAAELWARNPTEENRSAESAAWSAESAAWSAARSAESAARSAARSAESAAESAWSAWSAWSAESAAESAAGSAARSAARSAESAARSAESAAWKKILTYGLKLVCE